MVPRSQMTDERSSAVPFTSDSSGRDVTKADVEMTSLKAELDLEREEQEIHGQWGNVIENFLAVLGFTVGLGNIWRFPYICIRNGGGAFLIPFIISLLLFGIPLFLIEVAMGQFSGKSVYHVWEICPLFKGMGLGVAILSAFCWWYYLTVMAWTLVYMVNSVKSPQPWTRCDQWWNTPVCRTFREDNVTAALVADVNTTVSPSNTTGLLHNPEQVNVVSSSEEFWQHGLLQLSPGLHDIGCLNWDLAVALLVCNIILFVCVCRGAQSTGKAVYITATLPFLLLMALVIRGITLDGAQEGILFYMKPDFDKLFISQTWIEAAIQVFYSVGPCWGGLITLSSFAKFNTKFIRQSILIVAMGEGTSIFAGFAVFSVLGHMALKAGKDVRDVVKGGPGLAFIVYPEAISLMPLPQLWGFLFFFMIFVIGIDTQFPHVENLMTTLFDSLPREMVKKWRIVITAAIFMSVYLFGLIFVTQGGYYLFFLIDWYIGSIGVFIIGIIECLVIGWIYGVDRFSSDIELMLGRRPSVLLVIVWCYVTPISIMALFVITLTSMETPVYATYQYPDWAVSMGWIFSCFYLLPFIIVAGLLLLRARGSLLKRLKSHLRPGSNWLPSELSLRAEYRKTYACQYRPVFRVPVPCRR